MNSEKIRSIFAQEEISTEIQCSKAFEISEKFGIPKSDISKFCNENKIKIRACQLGCF